MKQMKKLTGMFRHNIGLKLVSILIAVVIWYAVVDNNDPVITKSYTVKVTVTNESYIASGKRSYTIDDTYKSVTVYLKGNRSEIRNVKADDITVTADLTQIVDMDTTPVMVPLRASCPGFDQGDIQMSRMAIPISIDEIASKEYTITVDTGGTSPGKNYEVGTTTPSTTQVVINGPQSVIDTIDSVVARINVSGMTTSATVPADIVLIDKNQAEISSTTIEDDLTFDGGMPDVTVEVELWKKQTDVSLDVEYSGSPASGYQVGEIKTTPDTITVVGDDDALAELKKNGNKITIPKSEISVSGATSDVSREIDLSTLMPENMRVSENTSNTAIVHIPILPIGSKEYDVDVDDIATQNLGSGLTVSYDQTSLSVIVKGTSSVMDSMTSSDITASIDLSDLGKGDYTLPVNIKLPSGVTLVNDVTIAVHVKEKAEVASSSSSS